MTYAKLGLVLIGALGFSTACSKKEPAPAADTAAARTAVAPVPAAPPQAQTADAAAATIFKQRCVACHGESGKGDGPGAAALNPKPRNYTDATWQSSITDDQLRKTIMLGGAAVGKSAAMPPNPDLEEKPEVVDGLVKIIRSYAGK